jgi:neutral trehalase
MRLLNDNQTEMAKDMADNFLYQVKYYGKVLNANRTYYLSRSQPPFLAQMVLGVYGKTQDRRRLENALPLVEQYYQLWVTEPHLIPETKNTTFTTIMISSPGVYGIIRFLRRSTRCGPASRHRTRPQKS